MSNSSTARPISVFSILAIIVCLSLFLLLVYWAYLPKQTGAFIGDGIRTAEERKTNLTELRIEEAKKANSYAWIDQSAGQVQLPIERAMELTVQRYRSQN
jgi:hypothetical protein